jgi:hypothetical protein
LNAEIGDDTVNLGDGFAIGHSYFCPLETPPDWEQWYTDVVQLEVGPLLREYWFDDSDKANEWIGQLLSQ